MGPQSLGLISWCTELGATIVAPSTKTCAAGKGQVYDYFILSAGLCSCVEKVQVWNDAPVSPHSPVEISLVGVSLNIPMHVRCVWKRLPTQMPEGCEKGARHLQLVVANWGHGRHGAYARLGSVDGFY
eukprot:6497017-Pyramimonas_sp.AAC.1